MTYCGIDVTLEPRHVCALIRVNKELKRESYAHTFLPLLAYNVHQQVT